MVRMASSVLPSMISHSSGTIVNIGSATSGTSQPFLSGYVASKAATRAWSEALRMELGVLGVKVVHVEPGVIDTGLVAGRTAMEWKAKEGSPYEGNASVLKYLNFVAGEMDKPGSTSYRFFLFRCCDTFSRKSQCLMLIAVVLFFLVRSSTDTSAEFLAKKTIANILSPNPRFFDNRYGRMVSIWWFLESLPRVSLSSAPCLSFDVFSRKLMRTGAVRECSG